MSSTYEHYFVADGGRVVSHKPVNLCIWAKCSGGAARPFTLAVKTSDDKIKRRLNKTEALAECYICCDTDPAYMRRRAQQDAAAAAAALLGHDVNSAAGAAATAPVPSTKAQMAARQEQLHYIGSKEIFVQHPGDKIVCLRLRAAEEPPTRKGKKKALAGDDEDEGDADADGAESAPAATPPPDDVGETSNGGFLFHVETKGGKSLGRQKQHYILLRSRCIYTLLLPTDVVITRIETKDKQGDTLALKHWISAHAQLATGPTACPTKFSAPEPEAVPAVPVTMPVTTHSVVQQQQQALAFMTASSLHAASAAAFSAQLQMGNSPFSSASISPASMSAAFAQPAAAPGSGISPSNQQPFLFPFNTHSPQQAAHLLVQQQQQQYLAASTALAGLSGFPAASALSMMLPSSGPNSRGHTNSFPSPSNVLLGGLGVGNALMLGGGSGGGGGLSSTLMSPALSNPPSNRSNVGMSTNLSPSNGVLLHTQQAHANQRQDSPPSGAAPKLEALSGDAEARQLQQQILQLQSILNQQTQLARQQQMQLEHHQMFQQHQFSHQYPYSQQQQQHQSKGPLAHGAAKVVPAVSRSKFDFGVGNTNNNANVFPLPAHTVFHQQQLPLHQPQQSVSPTRGLFQPKGGLADGVTGGADPFGPIKTETPSFPDSPQFAPSHLRGLHQGSSAEGHGNNTSSAGSTATNSLSNSAEGLGAFVRPGHGTHTHAYPTAHQQQQQADRFEASPSAVDSMMMQLDPTPHPLSHSHLHSHASPSAGALHSAYWNPPAPSMAMTMAPPATQGPDPSASGLMGSPDFLADDDFFSADPAAAVHHHSALSLEVPSSFFNSPLVHDSTESAGSSNASHASHSPVVQPLRLQSQRQPPSTLQQQQQQGGMSRSPSVDSLVPASTLAAALRPPAFPLLGPNILLDPSHSSSSSSSASGGRRAGKRKKSSSKRRGDIGGSSATSSVVSESARPSTRKGTGFTLSPRLWKVALKKPPFRATLSVTRSSAARFRSSDLVQIRFGGELLDAARVDVYKRQVLIDIPPPPSTTALMAAAGVAPHVAAASAASSGSGGALPHTTIEVDLELMVNGALKFATTFSYKLGPATTARAGASGGDTTSSSSEGDSDDDDSGDRSDSASDNDIGGGGGSPGSPDSPGGDDDADSGAGSKRRKADDSSNGGGGGGTQHGGVSHQSVRLSADLDSIPLFARGVLKTFPLLSLGLQELLQSYLVQASAAARGSSSGADDTERTDEALGAAASTVHDHMIVEEVDADFLSVPAASTLAARSSPLAAAAAAAGGARKRYSTGSHVLEKLKAAQSAAAKARMSPPSGPVAPSQTVPSTPVTRSPLRQRGRSRSGATKSAASRATARILFVQAISSQQPMQLVHAALSAATHAALHSDAASASGSASHFPFEGINGADSFGFTLLHYAVGAGALPLVDTLLSLGANPGVQARSSHASHAFTPAQLLQLRVVAEQQRAARREARAAKKASTSPSAALGRLLSRHGKKKRRTSGGGGGGDGGGGDNDEGSLASGPSQSDSAGSSGNSENGHQSCSEDSAMVAHHDSHASGAEAAPPRQGLFVGFSSLHSLAPSPFGSAHSSAASSLANTPTNASAAASSALKAARTPLTGRDILAATQSANKKSFHFGLADRSSAVGGGGGGGSLSSSPPAEKFFHHVQMHPQHPHQQQQMWGGGALHVYHAHHQLMHGPALHYDKAHAAAVAVGAAGAACHSTATTAAPTPSSHMNSVLSSPMTGPWRPSPAHQQQHLYASSMRSPPLSSLPLASHAVVPALAAATTTPSATDAAELNRQMGVIFHAHALSPQGLAMAAALAQTQAANAASEQLHSSAATAPNPALTLCPQLHAYVERRWRHVQAKKQLLSLQRQLRQLHAQQSPAATAATPSVMVQSEEDREQQRETVMLELARLIQHAQRHIAALKLHVPSSAGAVAAVAADSAEPALLSGPMRSLHIHTLSSLLAQFHLLRRYFLAHRRHQAEQSQLNNALAGIQLSDEREDASPKAAPRSRPLSTASVSSVSMGAFEPEAASLSASPTQDEASRSRSDEAPASTSQVLSDASVVALLGHAAAVECALRDRIVHMQRVLAPYMQRALLQAKMTKEKGRAQLQLRDPTVSASTASLKYTAGADASMTSPQSHSARSLPAPLSQGHLSRTHSGQLSLNIVGSMNPDREDEEASCIRVREIHAVDVLHREHGQPGRRIDLAINAALEEQESAAEVARDSARKQHGRNWEGDVATAASSRLQSPAAILAAASNKQAELAPSLFVAPHSTPAASVVSTPAARDSQPFQFHPTAAASSSSSLGASSSSPRSIPLGSKFALLVGLNQYAPAMCLPALLGCENDVMRMISVLQRFGYDAPLMDAQQHASNDADVAAATSAEETPVEFDRCRSLLLLNSQATRAALRRALVSLVRAAHSPGDSVLIYFSGHGLSSSLLLYDGAMEYAELTHLLEEIRTSDVTFVSDTCATDSPPLDATAAASAAVASSSCNKSLTLEELRRLVNSREAATVAQQHAAAEILAGISPEASMRRIAPRLHLPLPASSSFSSSSSPIAVLENDNDAQLVDVDDSPSDDDMDTQSAVAAAPSSKRRSGGGGSRGARVQYRGLAFNQIEPCEPSSDEPCTMVAAPDSPCSGGASDDDGDDDAARDGAVFPVIQRLLQGRGYFARGLLSRSDARAGEVRLQDGTWQGLYTKRLCDKLERFAAEADADADADAVAHHDAEADADADAESSPIVSAVPVAGAAATQSRRAEPANPRVVRLSAVLFHDEEDGNLSCGSASSSRSNSFSVASWGPLLAEHQADEIDPTSATADLDLDLAQLFAAARLDAPDSDGAAVVSPLADDLSGSDDDDNGDHDAASCAAEIAAFDAADRCATDGDSADEEVQLQESDPDAFRTDDDEPAQHAVAVETRTWLSLLLSIWTLLRITIAGAPAAATDSKERASPVSAPAAVSAAPKSFSVVSPSSSPAPPLEHVASDLLTTEAASDSSASCSTNEQYGAHGSDSDAAHSDPEQAAHKRHPSLPLSAITARTHATFKHKW